MRCERVASRSQASKQVLRTWKVCLVPAIDRDDQQREKRHDRLVLLAWWFFLLYFGDFDNAVDVYVF